MIDAKRREEIIQKADHDESRIIDLAEKAVREGTPSPSTPSDDIEELRKSIDFAKEITDIKIDCALRGAMLATKTRDNAWKSAVEKANKRIDNLVQDNDAMNIVDFIEQVDAVFREIFKEVGLE